MGEKKGHRSVKARTPGQKEVPILRRMRLDLDTNNTAYEIQRDRSGLVDSVSRLRDSGKKRKILRVRNNLFEAAAAEMRRQNVSGTLTNLSKTKKRSIRKRS